MPDSDRDIPKVLTKEIIDEIAAEMGLNDLDWLHYEKAHLYFSQYVDGPYLWRNVIINALSKVEEIKLP